MSQYPPKRKWFKSSRSGTVNANCLETLPVAYMYVRDSKNQTGPYLQVSDDKWITFIDKVRK